MCGIAGYLGAKKIPKERIIKTLSLMKKRGPDNQNFKRFKIFNRYLYLLHSRLNIIDINNRSNQPFIYKDYAIIFNGEIYNFKELKKDLIKNGVVFTTTSDTEVLLKAYIFHGKKFLNFLEGMWSFVIFDNKAKELFISRDRFGEKPLYYYLNKKDFYFGSEIKFIKSLSKNKFKINKKKLIKYLFLGYKSLKKDYDTFFQGIFEFPRGSFCVIKKFINFKIKKYWTLKYKPKNITTKSAILKVKKLLSESIKIRMRSDVPIACSLSGGIDSNVLIGYVKKKFKKKTKCFSIIDDNEKYNETKNLKISEKFLKTKTNLIKIPKKNVLTSLVNLINHHDAPISTINYFAHSYLTKKVSKDGFRVLISGVGADEIFSGYYDHTLQFLQEIKNKKYFTKELKNWKKKIQVHIRNPLFKNSNLYIDDSNYRDHIYNNHKHKLFLLKKNFNFLHKKFKEHQFCKPLMRNRMLNELFFEGVPVILHEEDLNCMNYSIENRAPYLDKKLIEFLYTIPTKILLQKGFTKFLLRMAGKSLVDKRILNDTKKVGFNFSINSIIDLKSKEFKKIFFSKENKIFQYISQKKLKLFINDDKSKDNEKFIFNFINATLFLKKFS